MKTWLLIPTMVLALAAAAEASEIQEQRRALAADGRVDIENLSGSVIVEAAEKNEVVLTGTLADDAEELDFSGDDKRIRIEVVFPSGSRNLRETESHLHVKVPLRARLRVEGVNIEIEATGLEGPLELSTVNGEIRVVGAPQSLDAQTVNGDIEVEGGPSDVELESVSGDIVLTGARGEIAAATVSGDIEISGVDFESVDLGSVSGTIRFTGAPAETGVLDFESHSGSVYLVLPSDLSAEIEVDTFSGDIENLFGPASSRKSEYGPGRELTFSVGSGDARISVNTFSGSVRMEMK